MCITRGGRPAEKGDIPILFGTISAYSAGSPSRPPEVLFLDLSSVFSTFGMKAAASISGVFGLPF
jgi:hypothetical protein